MDEIFESSAKNLKNRLLHKKFGLDGFFLKNKGRYSYLPYFQYYFASIVNRANGSER